MNANCAALTARAVKRRGPPRRAFASFFQAEITLEKRRKEEHKMTERQHATWGELLRDAVEKPGQLLEAYTAFHTYSFGNALLALEQCIRRNLQPGPLNTYRGWLERKRQVRKGEKGITLCMPMPFKKAAQTDSVQDDETAEPQTRYAFRFRAYWFVLAQTEGEDTPIPSIPGFDIDTALCALNITRTPFDELNGNIQGFAHGREIAVNPVAGLPHKTTLHELAHVVLGHTTSEKLVDSEQTARHIREVEAESVALICCETLGLEGADFCRAYIQHWLKTEKEIPNQSAARIFAAATSILKAGIPAEGSH
jgi:N-terminal domain of anti-restriction factor ArdC